MCVCELGSEQDGGRGGRTHSCHVTLKNETPPSTDLTRSTHLTAELQQLVEILRGNGTPRIAMTFNWPRLSAHHDEMVVGKPREDKEM